jgi:asparagine synthase (glutamine-hydrolysing)
MCGIVGFQGRFDRRLLQAMTDAVAHRGPDGQGVRMLCADEGMPTGLGHRRLSIIDLSDAGSQPMCALPDAGGGHREGLTLVYNGEIYNYRELRAALAADGHTFQSNTDSEALLHLYERDGLDMFRHLNGIFALAIHDARESGRPPGVERGALLLVRDHLGVKPLYYSEVADGLLFGSEIKALLHSPAVSREIDPVALHHTLAYLWCPAPRTMLAGVRKLEPGSAMIVQRGRIARQWKYYEIPYDGQVSDAGEGALAEELAERLRVAVKRQLVSDVPVGAFLSGGLDSSAVVAMMRAAEPAARFPCFSIGFRGDGAVEGNPNDLPYARQVAAHLGVDLHEIYVEPDAIHRLPRLIELLDEPQADPAPINALLIAEQSRAMGIPVLLSGAGGDDLFGGYRRHWALTFERRWSWLPRSVRHRLQHAAVSASAGSRWQSRPAMRRLAKMFAYAADDPDRRLVSYFFWSTDAMRRALYTDDLAARVGGLDAAEPLLRSLDAIPREHDRLQRMLYLETRHFLADHNLNYTDRTGMAAGVEVRVPLLDLDLVHFATRVPAAFKQRGRVGKAIFKRAMEPYLPRDVIYRPKSGFAVPLRRWLRSELRPMVEDTLNATALSRRGLFRPEAVAALVANDAAGRVDGAYTIFALMCIELWCRRFVDRPS